MKFFDSHAHIDFEPLSAEREAVIERAYRAKVTNIINVGTSISRSRKSIEIASIFPNIWAAVGLHPQSAQEYLLNEEGILKEISEMAHDERVVAIGEIGLDFYSSGTGVKGLVTKEQQDQQIRMLKSQIEIAQDFDLPIIFHVRDAWDQFFKVVEESRVDGKKAVIHCFTGDVKIAKKLVGLGFYVGFTGFVTFEQAKFDHIKESVAVVPLDKILIETDAPFLAPEPFRGKPNEPAYVVEVAKKIAELKGVTVEEVAEKTFNNAKNLFL